MSSGPDDSRVRLPRRIEADPRAGAIAAALAARPTRLWGGGALRVPVIELDNRLARVLEGAHLARRLSRGLENVEAKLDAERRGLAKADQRAGSERGVRVSRLLLLADDGAERLYRRVESLARTHGARLLVIRLDVDSQRLGAVLSGDGSPAKVLMLDHKDAVAEALFALGPDPSAIGIEA